MVSNDNAYGNVRRIQGDEFEGRFIGRDLSSPDFVRLAESFSVPAVRAEAPARLAAARSGSQGLPHRTGPLTDRGAGGRDAQRVTTAARRLTRFGPGLRTPDRRARPLRRLLRPSSPVPGLIWRRRFMLHMCKFSRLLVSSQQSYVPGRLQGKGEPFHAQLTGEHGGFI
ncbi:hypothetical protein GCM10010307_61290 [Streptomyces vastus]|uniref:Thiamine pyrophosphate enzyme TPP-binding domain-containing protein n=1 Tax=Streptomyces vastus TaxID=285451 RepID=A0ABN3RFL3_9ACTN